LAISKTDRDFYINTGIKITVTILGLYAVKQGIEYIVDEITGGATDPPPPVTVDGTKIPDGWTADALATLLKNQIVGFNIWYYPETLEKVEELNDEQLKLLYNTYTNLFERNLVLDIDSEYTYDKWGIETAYGRVVKRMELLGMY